MYIIIRKRNQKRKPVGFIFDLDGTLLDFEGASHVALNAPLLRFANKHVDWRLHASISGTPAATWSKEILNALQITEMTPSEYAHEWHEHIKKAFPTMPLLPGALELVKKCRAYFPGAKLAIATSSERINFDAKMSYHPELLQCFDIVVTGDEIPKGRGKPNPDIFLEAARRIQVDPKRCVVFEDAPSGALGGKRAGCMVVAIPDDRMIGNEGHIIDVADLIVKSLVEVDTKLLRKIYETLQTTV